MEVPAPASDETNHEPPNDGASSPAPTPRDLLPHVPIGHPDTMMSKESVRRAVECFETRPTDVVVATFPKTGTTLVTWICHLLRTDAAPFETDLLAEEDKNQGNESETSVASTKTTKTQEPFETLYEVVPWPLLSWDIGYDPNVQGSHFTPRVFKSHLRMASIYPGCRYVVTVRDPAKTVLSFYNFFISKKVPFLVDVDTGDENENENENKATGSGSGPAPKLKMDVSTFLVDMPFVKGNNLRASLWEYYAEYHVLMNCPSVLILVYEDFLTDMQSQIRLLSGFVGTTTAGDREEEDLVARVAAMSTKEYMAGHMSKFDEPYERALRLNRAGDPSQLAPGAKIAVQQHKQTFDEGALQFIGDRWSETMGPLGYKDYGAFAGAVRERNKRLFGGD